MNPIAGIHHVTCISGDAQRNLDFYVRVLGQRLVKTTVNFDQPGTHHLYYGDATGSPGTIITFFPWPGARKGRVGNGQVALTSYAIPSGSTGFWQNRLKMLNISYSRVEERGEETAIQFSDVDGVRIELVAHASADKVPGWDGGPVPAHHAVRNFFGVTLWEADLERTSRMILTLPGFIRGETVGDRTRFSAPGSVARHIDVIHRPGQPHGGDGPGVVHHVAFRAATDADQLTLQAHLQETGAGVTEVKDRQYFRSIYFREPGGVLFEIATDTPGFLVDESPEMLGTALKLPPWLEQYRGQIEASLPKLAV